MLPFIMPASSETATGFDLSNAAYASKNLLVTAQHSIFFDPTGTVFVGGSRGGLFFQFDCATPWDLSTATYASKSFNPTAQDTQMGGACFADSGTKLFMVGSQNDNVYQYTLSTPYDIATASYASKSFSVAAQENNPKGVALSSDGSKAYVVGYQNNTVYQYTLGTPWDASTGSYATKSKSVAAQGTDCEDVFVSPDGLKMFVVHNSSDSVYSYTMGTPFDMSTASYDTISFSVATQATNPTGMTFSDDGFYMYIGDQTLDTTFQYDL